MSALRSILFWLFLVLTLALGAYGYYALKKNKRPSVRAVEMLPEGPVFYFHCPDFESLEKKINDQNLIIDNLQLTAPVRSLCNSLNILDSVLRSDELLLDQVAPSGLHLAVYNKDRWLCVFNIQQLGSQQQVMDALARELRSATKKENAFTFLLQKQIIHCRAHNGVILLTNTEQLAHEAIEGRNKSFTRSPGYLAFESTLSEPGALAVYLDHGQLQGKRSAGMNLSALVKSGFSAGHVELDPTQLKMYGYLRTSPGDPLHDLPGFEPVLTAEVLANLPGSTVSFRSYAGTPPPDAHEDQFWNKINETAMFNLRQEFWKNHAGHTTVYRLENSQFQNLQWPVQDSLLADRHLELLGDSSHKKYLVRRITAEGLRLLPLTGLPVLTFITRYGSSLYLSADSIDLVNARKALSGDNTLLSEPGFSEYSREHLPGEFSYLHYFSPVKAPEVIAEFYQKQAGDTLTSENLKHFSFSLSAQKRDFAYRLHLFYEKKQEESEKKQGPRHNFLWTLNLDTGIVTPPRAFVNHRTQENEVLVQDEANAIYLVNAKGNLLWKAPLRERINSEVFMVDAFKSGKLQMLFSTANYLHLVDRNGNYVEGYPVKLPAESTAGLAVFDYERTKDYRLFIPCRDQIIYNYGISGKSQEGFVPFKTSAQVRMPVQHHRISDLDLLVAIDDEGRIYALNRKGAERLNLRNKCTTEAGRFHIYAAGSLKNSYILYVDQKNNLISRISLTDKKEIAKLGEEPPQSCSAFAEVDDNRSTDVLIGNEEGLFAYDIAGAELLALRAKGPYDEIDFYSDDTHQLLYGFSKEKKHLTLFDKMTGSQKEVESASMPLISELFKDHKKYMVIPFGRQLRCLALD